MAHEHPPSAGGGRIPGWVWLCIIGGGVALVAILAGFPLGILAVVACPVLHLVMGHGGGHGQPTTTGTGKQPWIRIVKTEEGEIKNG